MHFVCNVCGANGEERSAQENVKMLDMTCLRETISIRTASTRIAMRKSIALGFVQLQTRIEHKSMMEVTSWTGGEYSVCTTYGDRGSPIPK